MQGKSEDKTAAPLHDDETPIDGTPSVRNERLLNAAEVLLKKALIKSALGAVGPEKPGTTNPMNRHPVHKLFEDSREVCPYPDHVVEVPAQIQGTSFFPGGTGLWWGDAPSIPALPVGKVMILGHDFHSEAGYKWACAHQKENLEATTWLHLRELLGLVPIRLDECFFTNIYMGLREGTATTGRFPGAADSGFVDRCRNFFLRQVAMQQPRLILALGAYVPQFLAPRSRQLSAWTLPSSFSKRDETKTSIREEVIFDGVAIAPCVIASIVHPCMRNSNVHRRRWHSRDLHGKEAELELVRHAVNLAGMKGAA
jgi:uracil-DNA glycosylase